MTSIMQNCKANAKILILVSQFVLIIGIVVTLFAFFSSDGHHPVVVRQSKIAGPVLLGLAILMLALGCGGRRRFGMATDEVHIAGDAVTYGGCVGESGKESGKGSGKEVGEGSFEGHVNEGDSEKTVSGKKKGGWERFA